MIELLGCLLGATAAVNYGKYETEAPNPYITVSPDRDPIMNLGDLKAVDCRTEITITGACESYHVGKFQTLESRTEYNVCFTPDPSFNNILNADEDINLIKLNGNYFIMGEAINACDNGKRNVRQASYTEIVNCKSE